MKFCDCGEPKPADQEGCDRCMWLDGDNPKETRIIDALRMAVTPIDVVRIASLCGTTPRSVLRTIEPLIRNGRVEREEESSRSMPANYKLGESERVLTKPTKTKTKIKSAKHQVEIPGTERKRIDDIDDVIGEMLEARARAKEWSERAKYFESAFSLSMNTHKRALETDSEGRKVYVYRVGDVERVARLTTSHKVQLCQPSKRESVCD